VMLSRQKYKQQNHQCLSRVPWGSDGYWKANKTKLTHIDQNPTELIKGVRAIRSEIHKPINSIWKKEELPQEWSSQTLYLFIRGQ
jgi:hypothetical protein